MISSPSVIVLESGFDPSTLPNFHSTFIPKLSVQANKAWQNVGKTIPAVINNDPVCVLTCTFSNFDYFAFDPTKRPLLKVSSGRYWLEGDGTQKLFAGPSLNIPPYSIIYKYQKIANAGRSLSTNGNNWFLGAHVNDSTELYDGNFNSANTNSGSLAEWLASLVRTTIGGKVYFNGVDETLVNVVGDNPGQLTLFGTTLGPEDFNGKIFAGLITTGSLSDSDRVKAENYILQF